MNSLEQLTSFIFMQKQNESFAQNYWNNWILHVRQKLRQIIIKCNYEENYRTKCEMLMYPWETLAFWQIVSSNKIYDRTALL